MSYDSTNCVNCPYYNQSHLQVEWRTDRHGPPIELERHNSSTLIVALAPGVEEWNVGAPLQPTKKQGGTAGSRVARSWQRVGKSREDFDILNAVQCYPGHDGERDAPPHAVAICSCMNRLAVFLVNSTYRNVICLGNVAEQVVTHIKQHHNLSFKIRKCPHPSGGAKNSELDSVW